jgi:hypothetical protein
MKNEDLCNLIFVCKAITLILRKFNAEGSMLNAER